MKMQNILGALLLAIASQSVHAGDVRIWNNSDKRIKITLVLKNNTRDTKTIEPTNFDTKNQKRNPHWFTTTTSANPIKEIYFSYLGENKLFFTPIHSTKNTNDQYIYIHYPKYVDVYNSYVNQDNFVLKTGEEHITAQEVHEDV